MFLSRCESFVELFFTSVVFAGESCCNAFVGESRCLSVFLSCDCESCCDGVDSFTNFPRTYIRTRAVVAGCEGGERPVGCTPRLTCGVYHR